MALDLTWLKNLSADLTKLESFLADIGVSLDKMPAVIRHIIAVIKSPTWDTLLSQIAAAVDGGVFADLKLALSALPELHALIAAFNAPLPAPPAPAPLPSPVTPAPASAAPALPPLAPAEPPPPPEVPPSAVETTTSELDAIIHAEAEGERA